MKAEISKVIVGHDDIIHGVLTCLFVGGHALLEGVPGLGKTLLIRTLADTLSLDFNRIQFTPDLMPADIIGTNIVMETPDGKRTFVFQRGPIFSQIVLADEINRATPKTQSAMLEAMQEHSVTVGGTIHTLQGAVLRHGDAEPDRAGRDVSAPRGPARPVHVQARRRLLDPRGVDGRPRPDHPEREAQGQPGHLRRDPDRDAEARPRGDRRPPRPGLRHPPGPGHPPRGALLAVPITNQYVRWGSSPRGAQTLVLAAKVRALLDGRFNVSFEDLRRVYLPALRHRTLLNFEAQAEGVNTDDVLLKILDAVPEKAEERATAKAG